MVKIHVSIWQNDKEMLITVITTHSGDNVRNQG